METVCIHIYVLLEQYVYEGHVLLRINGEYVTKYN
jgi:hypothetical protein